MQPLITIFCAFTRSWAVDQWLKDLEATKHDQARTNLVFIVDGEEATIQARLRKYCEAREYRSYKIVMNENWSVNETRLAVRRMRVADVHNQSKPYIAETDGEIIIGLEDDTVFSSLGDFERLYGRLLNDPDVGFVEGVQMGRWGAKIIGAWIIDDHHDPKRAQTVLPEPWKNTELITAGGFYGYATRRHLYLNHEYYTSSSQPWGPDVNYGIWLNQKGYLAYIDWTIEFGHNDHEKILYPSREKKLDSVVFEKDFSTGRWNRTDYEKVC